MDYNTGAYIEQKYTETKPYLYPTWDSDLQTWLDSHNAPLLDYQINKINDFVLALKSNGLWTKIHALYILKTVLPNDITPYWKYNLKSPTTYPLTFTNDNVTTDRIRAVAYFSEDYITKGNTGYIFTEEQRSNKHLMFFADASLYTVTVNDIHGYNIGQSTIQNGVIDALAINDRIDAGDVLKFRCFLSDNNNINIGTPSTGFHCISRLNATNVSGVRDGSVVIDDVASAIVEADNGLPILIGYANDKVGLHTGNFASIGEGLTQAEMVIYSSLVDTLNTGFYNMELSGEYYGGDFVFATLPKMKEYITDGVEIHRLEINGVPAHLLAQRGDIKVAFLYKNVTDIYLGDDFYISIDCGDTWTRKRWIYDDKHYASNVRFMHIFDSGDILFATRYNKLWRSTDNLTNISEITLKNADNSDYVYHTPVNANYPGSYFKRWGNSAPADINGTEVLVWTNWGQDTFESQGANPTNIYYSKDNGATVKIAYVFGQNSGTTDDGTASGGTGGNLLGDAGNPIVVYHGHNVCFNSNDDTFWAMTGEENANARWMQGTYDMDLDTWTWVSKAQGDVAGAAVRSGLFWWKNGYLHWISDAYQVRQTGIFKILEADIGKLLPTYAKLIHPIKKDAGAAMAWGDEIISGNASVASDRTIYYSKDGGVSWYQFTPYTQNNTTKSSGWMYKDTNGYFAYQKYNMPTAGSYFESESYLIKFKI